MRRLLGFAKWIGFLVLVLPLLPHNVEAQTSPHLVQFDNWVREYLAAEWDAHASDSVKFERGYCLTFQRDYVWGLPGYRVTKVDRAKVIDSTAYSIYFECPKGTESLHIHPAQTSYPDGSSEEMGPDSFECFPSGQDERALLASLDVFAVVQCDRRALIVYWPSPDK